jgi:RNA polymerase sigma-70 factor (ECF subfamily)
MRALYERYKDEVYSFLAHLLADDALAEDAWHEAFTRAWLNIERCDPDRFRPWLYQIARNSAFELRRIRTSRDRAAAEQPVPAREVDPVPVEAQRREAVEIAQEVLRKLPAATRALLAQRHGLGMTLDELACSWGVSERTVRNRLDVAASLVTRRILQARGAST